MCWNCQSILYMCTDVFQTTATVQEPPRTTAMVQEPPWTTATVQEPPQTTTTPPQTTATGQEPPQTTNSELRAKIADFGNSRIMYLDPDCSHLEYMPPGGCVTYDPSLDVFYFGHLSLFTTTVQQPPQTTATVQEPPQTTATGQEPPQTTATVQEPPQTTTPGVHTQPQIPVCIYM